MINFILMAVILHVKKNTEYTVFISNMFDENNNSNGNTNQQQ